jgi:multiple sugar transport system permease protein
LREKRSLGTAVAYGLLLPFLLYSLVLWLYPFLWGLVIGLKRWNIISPAKEFVGLQNFFAVFHDPLFWISFRNTLYFMVVFVPLSVITSLGLALLLNRIRFLRSFFASGYLMSYVSAGVAYSIVFSILFSGDGLVNRWLSTIGLSIPWFSDPRIAMASIALIVTWKYVGYYALVFMAGLQAIPRTLYEAAALDGATAWTQFRRITLPLLNPSFTIILVLGVMLCFNIFMEPYMITGGGPLDATQTFLMQIYYQTFSALHAGYGSSFAIVVGIISFAFVYVVRKSVERDISLS